MNRTEEWEEAAEQPGPEGEWGEGSEQPRQMSAGETVDGEEFAEAEADPKEWDEEWQTAEQTQMPDRGEQLLNEQMLEIMRLEPEIRSLEDLVRMENFAQFDRMVRGGCDLVTAYKAASYESVGRKRAAAARRAALNTAAGKRHMAYIPMIADVGRGEEIPAEALGVWREMFPGESPARLRARYNKALCGE